MFRRIFIRISRRIRGDSEVCGVSGIAGVFGKEENSDEHGASQTTDKDHSRTFTSFELMFWDVASALTTVGKAIWKRETLFLFALFLSIRLRVERRIGVMIVNVFELLMDPLPAASRLQRRVKYRTI